MNKQLEQELVEYCRKALEKGASEALIQESLQRIGYARKVVEEWIKHAKIELEMQEVARINQLIKKTERTAGKHLAEITIAVLFLIALFLTMYLTITPLLIANIP
ncbi:hypothetical protein HYS48_00080 [Candidatus Woesearchaeota archaeon]|nr:hypothetical protein [Candidatus Woesearchaeota archaeon]